MAKHFNIWFGGIFLAVGAVSLVVAAILAVVLRNVVGLPDAAWEAMAAPSAVGIGFSLFGGAIMAVGLRRRRIDQRLRAFGTTTEATVVGIEQTGVRVNRRRLWRVRYTFIDLSGAEQRGDSGYLSSEEAHSYIVGEQVLVRYDPADPTMSAWLGREEYPS
jgi:hypothetical protein